MSVVAECLSRLTLGETQTYHNLVIFPLVSEGNDEPQYQLLDEALKQGCARVTEVSESGRSIQFKMRRENRRSALVSQPLLAALTVRDRRNYESGRK
jgi:hypothetical protein